MAALLPATTNVKVALKTMTDVYSFVTVENAEGDTVPVACTFTTPDCAAYPGATCRGSFCTMRSSVPHTFYVQNEVLDPAGAATIGVPCDGRVYTVELYGARAPESGIYPITERHVSVPFTMSAGCATTPGDVWAGGPTFPTPALAIPTIYQAGLGEPYDTYTVVSPLAYPWTGPWTVTNPALPIRRGAASATFAAPAGTGAITFTERFHLDRSLLLAGEPSNAWELAVPTTTTEPIIRVGTVTGP